MNLKKMLFPLALIASFAPLAAFADHDGHDRGERERYEHGRWGHDRDDFDHDRWHHREWGPVSPYRGYSQRVERWIPGHYQQVWVPQQCQGEGYWSHGVRCYGGFYENRWVPGHYEG